MSSPAVVPVRRRSLAGPVVLIIIGLLFLLRNFGLPIPMFRVFAQWWPLLLILWGAIRMFEHWQAKREGTPEPRMGGGGITLLVFLILVGLGFSAAWEARQNVNWGEVRDEMHVDDDFMGMFGHDFNYEQQLEQDIPAGAAVKIVTDRGSVSVSSWDQNKIKVVVHKRIFASNQQEADQGNSNSQPQIQVAGQNVTLNANTQGGSHTSVASDLEVYLPAKGSVEISARRGDVNIAERQGDVKVDLQRGDVTVENVSGAVAVSMRNGTMRATKVTGNVTLDGRLNELVAEDVSGAVTVNADVMGEVRLSKVAKGVSFHTSRTDLELAKLDGELAMDRGDLRADNVYGPTHMTVRAKDVHLESVSGELRINSDVGDVTLGVMDKQPLGNIEISSRRGDVRLTLPSQAGYQVDASTRHGAINSDFSELNTSTSGNTAVVKGSTGKGNAKIVISSDAGDIDIRKAS